MSFNNQEEIYQFSVLSQFQSLANGIVESYDYNDVKSAMAFAKDSTKDSQSSSFDEAMKVINELFFWTMDWLEENGKKFE